MSVFDQLAIYLSYPFVLNALAVGALLLSALVVFPALAAIRVCKTFRGVTVLASAIGVACALMGMLASILLGTPVGSTIVVFDAVVFCLFSILGSARGQG